MTRSNFSSSTFRRAFFSSAFVSALQYFSSNLKYQPDISAARLNRSGTQGKFRLQNTDSSAQQRISTLKKKVNKQQNPMSSTI